MTAQINNQCRYNLKN